MAILNLAVNARDAMHEGGKLTIKTANIHLDERYATSQVEVVPGQYVMLAVTDNGSGMPEELIEKIFIPFFSTRKTGSGIGLSLCKQIMMLHKGSIQVQSVEGEGSAFLLYF